MADPAERLRHRIRAGGPVPFALFMEEALYGEGGYYARQRLPVGEAGDFVTGSSLTPLFGRTTARLLLGLDRLLGRPADLLEAGYGGGEHLAAVAEALGSHGRRLLAWDRVARPVPDGVSRLGALEEVGPGGLDGLVFSYELFDALPVHRLIGRSGAAGESGGTAVGELWVTLDDAGAFTWREGELSDPALSDLLRGPLEPGQIADLSPGWRPLYRALADRLGRGLLVTCDYGFTSERLLDPRVRRHGTLACYREQRVHRDPFADPGGDDLTAHVDLSVLVEEGEAAGLETLWLTRQAPWLAACGLLDEVAGAAPAKRLPALQLMELDGMGEEIRVLVQGRGVGLADLVRQLPGLTHLATGHR